MMARGAVSWKSVKQTLTATSTMEAEYVTCYEVTCQALWLKKLIFGFHIVESISKPLVVAIQLLYISLKTTGVLLALSTLI